MNSNAIGSIVATFGLLVGALYVAFDIFTSGGNAVARFYMYFMVASGVYGLLNPRRAFYLVIFLTGYLDFFKRFIIFDSSVSKMDLYYVLGIAPAATAGIVANLIYQSSLGKVESRPHLNMIGVICAMLAAVVVMVSFIGNKGTQAAGNAVNSAIYISLLFIVPVLFRTPDQLKKVIKFVIIIFIPSVLYMILHHWRAKVGMNTQFGGLFDYEVDYLKSGLTIEIRQLAERTPRPHGTLNSATNASSVFAGILGLLVSGMWRFKNSSSTFKDQSAVSRYIFIPFVLIAMFATYSRTGWVLAVLMIFGIVFIRSKVLTILSYIFIASAFLTVVLTAGWMLRHQFLNELSKDMYAQQRTDEWAQTTNISTFNDRLEGLQFLSKSTEIWTPFGYTLAGRDSAAFFRNNKTHDLVTQSVVRFGYISIIVVILASGFVLLKFHRLIYSLPKGLAKNMAGTCLALFVSEILGAIANPTQIMTYPVNFYIWFFLAVVVSLHLWKIENDMFLKNSAVLPEDNEEPARPIPVGFRRAPQRRPVLAYEK